MSDSWDAAEKSEANQQQPRESAEAFFSRITEERAARANAQVNAADLIPVRAELLCTEGGRATAAARSKEVPDRAREAGRGQLAP